MLGVATESDALYVGVVGGAGVGVGVGTDGGDVDAGFGIDVLCCPL